MGECYLDRGVLTTYKHNELKELCAKEILVTDDEEEEEIESQEPNIIEEALVEENNLMLIADVA
jgi:hypothetical protein